MHPVMRFSICAMAAFLFLGFIWEEAIADDFFFITKAQIIGQPGPSNANKKASHPFIEVDVKTAQRIEAKQTIAKIYFYDQDKKLIKTVPAPRFASHGSSGKYAVPFYYTNDKVETLFFDIPAELAGQPFTALAVFGDANEIQARTCSGEPSEDYDFPEKELFLNRPTIPVERKVAMDPLVEYVVTIDNPKQPKLTLFLLPPIGMTDASQAQGVLALCLLGADVEDVRKQLQGITPNADVQGIMKFAMDHKLLILCWGYHRLWDPTKGYDEQSVMMNEEMDSTFDQVADGWAAGVDTLSQKYGFPNRDFLLFGYSNSAQYACRLAMRKPQYFLAAHLHGPNGSYDKPTVEGNKVLWCLTIGELDPGYENAKKFYAECRALGYPMLFKGVIGLGHTMNKGTQDIGVKFFEYALSVRDQRDALDDPMQNPTGQVPVSSDAAPQPWLQSFREPPFVGDIVNQGMYPFDQQDMVPLGFRTSLPTQEIANVWNQQP